MAEAPLESKEISELIGAALDRVLEPVRDDFAEVRAQLDSVLITTIPTAEAVSAYIAKNKGKGLRPALLLLAARTNGEITPEIRTAAVGVELLQISTLLHDDVIDNSPIRRGMPSINARWGNDVAVLMGDMLFTQAVSSFVSTGSLPVMEAGARQSRLLIEGEIFARDLRKTPDFSEASYLELIRRKTGALMSLAAEIGIMLSHGSEEQIDAMRRYGEHLGLAFQIADDLLDVIGDPRIVGKPTGQDLREGTVTLPLIRALDAAPEDEAEAIRTRVRAGITSDGEWEAVRDFIYRYNGIESAHEVARSFTALARQDIETLPDTPARTGIVHLLEYVIERNL